MSTSIPSSMQAVLLQENGAPLTVGQIPIPQHEFDSRLLRVLREPPDNGSPEV